MTLESYVLHITKKCNMQCKYCYETDKTSEYTWDEIKYTLDNIIKYNKEFNLEFLGGEPCLEPEYIRRTVEYLTHLGININYTITTNGTILSDDLIELLKEYPNISWAASMDGNRFMNCLRVTKDGYNSYNLVISNHKKLESIIDINRIHIHMVTHPFNISFFVKGIEDLYSNGIRNIGVGTVETTIKIGREYCLEFIKQHDILSENYINNKYPGLSISSFEYLKPRNDKRYYIKDENNKTILETYGRVENDIKDSVEFKSNPSTSDLGDTIVNLREIVYLRHQKRKELMKNDNS